KAPLRRAIKALGFKVPTPIQAQALPVLLGEPVDFIGQAMTGTGKTATYGLPILQNVKPGKRALQALILTPTRELALQISQQLEQLGQNLDLEVLPIYGGADHGAQLRGLQQGTPVAVATPGRLLEHIRRGTVSLDTLNTLVLDEADQMMSLGFREEVEAILAKRPPKRCRIWMFSATLSKEVRQIAEKWLRDPKMVLLNAAKDLPPDLRQEFFATQESNKPEVLSKLLDAESPYGLIFCQTKSLASELTTYLAVRGYPVACLHGDKDQHAREAALTAFREHEVELLVCTDVAARGLDIPEVTHVINYSLPRESDVYLHRVGRTARSGKAGKVLNLISPTQRGQIRHLQDVLGTEIPEGQIPSRRELGAKKLDALLARFLTQDPYRAMDLLTPDWIEALGEISRRELAGRFISLLMPEIFGQEPASKQVLGKRPLEEVEDDENDEDFERIIAAAQKRKAYQSIAPRTRLSEREAGKQLDHASEKRSPRTPSDKTSRELRRLDAVERGFKPRSAEEREAAQDRPAQDRPPKRFVRVERFDADGRPEKTTRERPERTGAGRDKGSQGERKPYGKSEGRSYGKSESSERGSRYKPAAGRQADSGERKSTGRSYDKGTGARYDKGTGGSGYERRERPAKEYGSREQGSREYSPREYGEGSGKTYGKSAGRSYDKSGGSRFEKGAGTGRSYGKGPSKGPGKSFGKGPGKGPSKGPARGYKKRDGGRS
ncbi:MAG TPA: DEAD/DEAH box helicase, partial [Candidatus Obscuribacterales bacterium]